MEDYGIIGKYEVKALDHKKRVIHKNVVEATSTTTAIEKEVQRLEKAKSPRLKMTLKFNATLLRRYND